MKRNQHQVTKKVSRNRAAPQSKTAAASQARNQTRSGTGVFLQRKAQSEEVRKLNFAILSIPMSEPGKLPPKADEAVVELASRLGCVVSLARVWRQVRRLANRPNPLIRCVGSRWKVTKAGRREHLDLYMDSLQQDRDRRLAAGVVTCVWTKADGSEFARVDFERELWSRIERAASELGITLQQLFDNAVHDYCSSRDSRRAA